MDQTPDQEDVVDLDMDATEDQIAELRRFGVGEDELRDLTAEEAEEWIDELRAQRQNAGRFGAP